MPLYVAASVLILSACLAAGQSGSKNTTDVPTDSYVLSAGDLTSQSEAPLGHYTRSLLAQNLSVVGQTVLLPAGLFLTHPCQVLFLGNPDWATLNLDVLYVSGAHDSCPQGRPRAFFAYIDGYNTPTWASGVTLLSGRTPWAAVVTDPNGISTNGSSGSRVPNSTADLQASDISAAAVPPPPPTQQRRRMRQPEPKPVRLLSRLRRMVAQISIGGLTVSSSHRETFQSAYDRVRGQTLATQELLRRGSEIAPGPDGPLSVPVMASSRHSKTLVASPSTYTAGALESGGAGAVSVLSDDARVYWAPEDVCLRALSSAGPRGRAGASGGDSAVASGGTSQQDSCFVSQLVVYIYNPCIYSRNADSTSTAGSSSSSTAASGADGNNATFQGRSVSPDQQRVLRLLDGAVWSSATGQTMNRSSGYGQVMLLYHPYDRCVRKGVDMLADVSLQVILFSVFAFGWLLLFLLLPSFWRLFLEFPSRLVAHAARKFTGANDDLKPMKPGLHSHKRGGRWRLGGIGGAILGPLLHLRKCLLYAVATVHYADGQSRWLQVSVISNVALCIAMAVYSPKLSPPLEHFVPPLALQITKTKTALASLQYFFTIVLFSSFMGTLGYLSMLANYNSPINQYYRVQCCLSAFFMILQDLLILLQVVSLLAEWHYLRPSWPYLPMITFQLANLLAANVLQVMIFSKRHEERNQNVYAAYIAARQGQSMMVAHAPAHQNSAEASMAGTPPDSGCSSGGEPSTAAEEEVLPVLAAGAQSQPRKQRPSADGGALDRTSEYIDFKRHRQRLSSQRERGQEQHISEDGGHSRPQPLAAAAGVASRGRRRQADGQEASGGRANGHAALAAGSVQLAALGRIRDGDSDRVTGAGPASRPRRRLLLFDGEEGPGPVAEGREGDGDDSEESDLDDSSLALLRRESCRRSTKAAGVAVAGGGQWRRVGWRRGAAEEHEGEGIEERRPEDSGDDAGERGKGGTHGVPPRFAASGRGEDSRSRRLQGGEGDVEHSYEDVPYHKRRYTRFGAVGAKRADAAPEAVTVQVPDSPVAGPKERQKKPKARGRAPHGSSAGHEGGLWRSARAIARRAWHGVRESPDFRYPAWLLAALLVSGYMVIFHFARALEWSGAIKECILDPAECATNTLGRYIRFAARLFSRGQQAQLQESLTMLLGTEDQVTNMVTSAVDTNMTEALAQSATASLVSQLTANLSSTLNGTLMPIMSGALRQYLEAAGYGRANGTGGPADDITPGLVASMQSRLSDALTDGTLENVIQQQASAAVTRVVMQQAAAQAAVASVLNATVVQLYNTVNVTAGFLNRTLQVEAQVSTWQHGLSSRFAWSSVVGFTLGLMLGLSTLVQTAVSFKRAVRQSRRMRVARRMLTRLLESTGAAAGAGTGAGGPGGFLLPGEDSLLSNRALKTDISLVVFFFGVLMSTAVIQLYMVGVLLSVALAVLTHPWTWKYLFPRYWLYLAAVVAVVVLNKFILIGYVGSAFLSNGDHIYRPAAWLAFTVIMSITNLVVGLLLAVYRVVMLLLTTVLALGKLEVTIFTFFQALDLPHNSFLAGLHLHEAMANFHDPIYLPGPRGAAHRRWRKLRDTVRRLKPEELRLMATLGRPKEVQEAVDHVVVNMHAAKALAAGSFALDGSTRAAADGSTRPPADGSARLRAGGAAPVTAAQGQAQVLVEARPSRFRPPGSAQVAGSDPLASGARLRTDDGQGRSSDQHPVLVEASSHQDRPLAVGKAKVQAAAARRHAEVNAGGSRYETACGNGEEGRFAARSRGRNGTGAAPQGRARRLYGDAQVYELDAAEQPHQPARLGKSSRSARRAAATDSPDELL